MAKDKNHLVYGELIGKSAEELEEGMPGLYNPVKHESNHVQGMWSLDFQGTLTNVTVRQKYLAKTALRLIATCTTY
ncbi:hypothetical protein [Daejeonella sp.]|uniref:hypothetical protein n=1 Tax=Daejeonella sp. TaxID=2805397 RepID=UPI0030BC5D17